MSLSFGSPNLPLEEHFSGMLQVYTGQAGDNGIVCRKKQFRDMMTAMYPYTDPVDINTWAGLLLLLEMILTKVKKMKTVTRVDAIPCCFDNQCHNKIVINKMPQIERWLFYKKF